MLKNLLTKSQTKIENFSDWGVTHSFVAVFFIFLLHSLFSYSPSFLRGYYPLKDPGTASLYADFFIWLIWEMSCPILFLFSGKISAKAIKEKGIETFFRDKILFYLKNLAIVFISCVILWKIIFLFNGQQNTNYFEYKLNNLWMPIYIVFCNLGLYLLLKSKADKILPKLNNYNFLLITIPFLFLISTKTGLNISNPANSFFLTPKTFFFFFSYYIIGFLDQETKYVVSGKRFLLTTAISALLFYTLFLMITWIRPSNLSVSILMICSFLNSLAKFSYLKFSHQLYGIIRPELLKNRFFSYVHRIRNILYSFNLHLIFLAQTALLSLNSTVWVKIVIINFVFWALIWVFYSKKPQETIKSPTTS